MNKYFIYLAVLCMSISHAFGQNLLGPKIMAMGNNGAAVKDIWSVAANTAAMSETLVPTLSLNYAPYYFDKELTKQALAFIIPSKRYRFGLTLQRYGINAYNEISAGLALAKKFGEEFSIGLKVNYHQLKISNYGAATAFSLDVGLLYQLNKEITIGLYATNPSAQNYSHQSLATTIPAIIHFGIAYQVSSKILLASTIHQDLSGTIDGAIGIDYQLIEALSLRTGLSLRPFKQYAGLAFDRKKLKLAIAIESDPHLGYSPQIAIAYAF